MQSITRQSSIQTPGRPGQLPRRQRGAVLVVGLVMLTVMTMLVVSMLKTSIIDLKIGGVSQDAIVNVNNADVILSTYFNLNTGKFSNNCITLPGALSCNQAWVAPVLATPPQFVNTPAAMAMAPTTPPTPLQMYCGDKPGFTGNQVGTSFQSVVIDASIWLTSTLTNQTRLHLGIAQDLPPGSCSS
jgi:Tfp pilus assembly protein PilX